MQFNTEAGAGFNRRASHPPGGWRKNLLQRARRLRKTQRKTKKPDQGDVCEPAFIRVHRHGCSALFHFAALLHQLPIRKEARYNSSTRIPSGSLWQPTAPNAADAMQPHCEQSGVLPRSSTNSLSNRRFISQNPWSAVACSAKTQSSRPDPVALVLHRIANANEGGSKMLVESAGDRCILFLPA